MRTTEVGSRLTSGSHSGNTAGSEDAVLKQAGHWGYLGAVPTGPDSVEPRPGLGRPHHREERFGWCTAGLNYCGFWAEGCVSLSLSLSTWWEIVA